MEMTVPSDYGKSYMKIRFSMNTQTRATASHPQGGEDGDGRELGIYHENEVKNVMIFIFRHTDGFDAPGSTTFLYKGYFDTTSDGWQTVGDVTTVLFEVEGFEPQDNDRVIVVANAGYRLGDINNLEDLRDYHSYTTWQNGATLPDNTHFVMSSAYNNGGDGIVYVSAHDGSKVDPYFSSLSIQRAAARIDFMYNNTDNLPETSPYYELLYKVTKDPDDRSSEKLGTVHLQNIIPVNLMCQPSYLIKRVTTDHAISSAIRYGAFETSTGSPVYQPTNYVIEPHTLTKETMDIPSAGTTLDSWYGSTRAKTVFDNPGTYATTSNGINKYITATNVSQSELGYFTHYMTLAYTNENTQSKEKHDPNFMTGLLLKTIYEPVKVYKNEVTSATDLLVVDDDPTHTYATGYTFWRYTPTKSLMEEKNSLYFSSKEAADAYKKYHPEDLAEIVKYENGICYYNLWLRHANVDSDPHVTFPMEYGIVRNNIYRVGVDKFTGPGTPTPTFEGPTRVHLRIFVRPWNKRVHPEILL